MGVTQRHQGKQLARKEHRTVAQAESKEARQDKRQGRRYPGPAPDKHQSPSEHEQGKGFKTKQPPAQKKGDEGRSPDRGNGKQAGHHAANEKLGAPEKRMGHRPPGQATLVTTKRHTCAGPRRAVLQRAR